MTILEARWGIVAGALYVWIVLWFFAGVQVGRMEDHARYGRAIVSGQSP